MKQIFEIKENIRWIDILSPEAEDFQFLEENFDFHPITIDELSYPSNRTKIDHYGHYLFIISHFPVYNFSEKCCQQTEIDILIDKSALITIHYQELEILDEFKKNIQNEKIKKEIARTYHLLYYILEYINQYSLRQLIHIEQKINKTGEELFKNKERELLEQISYIKRDLANFGIIIWNQKNILESLGTVTPKFWNGDEIKFYFADILGDHWRLIHAYNKLKETLLDFDTTNAQLLDYKMNKAMQVMSVLGFIALPLILFLSVFQVNFINDLVINQPWIALLIFVLAAGLSFIFWLIFRKKKWI